MEKARYMKIWGGSNSKQERTKRILFGEGGVLEGLLTSRNEVVTLGLRLVRIGMKNGARYQPGSCIAA